MPANASVLPVHRGFQSSLPSPASRGELSASPHTLAPAAFPADAAVGTEDRGMWRERELHLDGFCDAGRTPRPAKGRGRDKELTYASAL